MQSALATPPLLQAIERRRSDRVRLTGVVEVHLIGSDWYGPAWLIDIGEGGMCLSVSVGPLPGEALCVEVNGLVSEGRVRNIGGERGRGGTRWRIGIEVS